ncbi:MAG: threonine synthase [Pseudomonadota bacterium]
MKYVSTRGNAPDLGFRDALLTGLARDGGLYVPQEWPQFSTEEVRSHCSAPYAEVAKTILRPFVEGEIDPATFDQMIDEAYATFHHPAVAPLVQIDHDQWVLELFHGPTLAFKDVAMQLLARMMDHVLAERGERATIVGATSGDTGGAAIEAFRSMQNIDMFILFPKGRVSPVQQRQMTSVDAPNVHPLCIEGDFDDCQALVKSMFNHMAFRDEVKLSGVNSINWGRIMAQIVYFFTAASALGAPDRKVSFTVPTGNFGDIFAGYCAKRMGLPIDRLIIATNTNDILTRTLDSGRYETRSVVATASPSMDIQVSSNFERLLFEASDRDAGSVNTMMSSLSQSGAFQLEGSTLATIRNEFDAGAVDEETTASTIASTLSRSGYLLDPHTAVGVKTASNKSEAGMPMVTLATAHPAKFPDAVSKACGVTPALPQWQGDLMNRRESFTVLKPELEAVEEHIRTSARINA